MKTLAKMLNQEGIYPDVYFFSGEEDGFRCLYYDNLDYFNNDEMKEYVINKALSLFSEEELDDFIVLYKERPYVELEKELNNWLESALMDFAEVKDISIDVAPTDKYVLWSNLEVGLSIFHETVDLGMINIAEDFDNTTVLFKNSKPATNEVTQMNIGWQQNSVHFYVSGENCLAA